MIPSFSLPTRLRMVTLHFNTETPVWLHAALCASAIQIPRLHVDQHLWWCQTSGLSSVNMEHLPFQQTESETTHVCKLGLKLMSQWLSQQFPKSPMLLQSNSPFPFRSRCVKVLWKSGSHVPIVNHGEVSTTFCLQCFCHPWCSSSKTCGTNEILEVGWKWNQEKKSWVWLWEHHHHFQTTHLLCNFFRIKQMGLTFHAFAFKVASPSLIFHQCSCQISEQQQGCCCADKRSWLLKKQQWLHFNQELDHWECCIRLAIVSQSVF